MLLLCSVSLIECTKGKSDPPDTVRDIDGNLYKTIKIGNQIWMAENLRVTKLRNGISIPTLSSAKEWSGASTQMCCDYELIAHTSYGKLYNWFAVEEYDGHYLSPEGWHIPTREEWQTLFDYLGGSKISGGKLKDTINWPIKNVPNPDKTLFQAPPAGYRDRYGIFMDLTNSAMFWSSTRDLSFSWYHYCIYLSKSTDQVSFIVQDNYTGLSVRCIKD